MAGCVEEKHGAYAGHVRKRYSDKRTQEGRKLKAVMNSLVQDLGGRDKLNSAQRIILQAIEPKLVTLWQISKYIDENHISLVDKETGDIIPVIKNTYSVFAESIRRDLECMFLMKRSVRHSDYEKAIKSLTGRG